MSLTWTQFKTAVRVFLHNYNEVSEIQTLIDASIAQGAADIQRVVPFYQTGHTDTYNSAQLTNEGFAYLGTLPAGKITSARMVKYDTTETVIRPNVFRTLKQVGWDKYPKMRGGEAYYGTGAIALNPVGRQFAVVPLLNAESRLVIEWQGIKTTFDDGDLTPFDERMAEVVSDFVLHRIKRTVDKDQSLTPTYERSYVLGKRKLLSDANWNAVVETKIESQLDGDETFSGATNSIVENALFEFRPDITVLPGDLAAVVTATGVASGSVFLMVISGIPNYWRLVASNEATAVLSGWVRPDDYNVSANPRAWERIS